MKHSLSIAISIFIISILTSISYADDSVNLIKAAEKGDISAVRMLLAKGVNPNFKDNNNYDETALMGASANGHLDIVKELIYKGADLNAKYYNGWTALMMAAAKGHIEVVELLLAKGADINEQSNDGYTALSMAKVKSHNDIAQLLIKKGANDNRGSYESAAFISLKAICTACDSFKSTHNPPEYPSDLKALAKTKPPYIDAELGGGKKNGYKFTYTRLDENRFTCIASPEDYGARGGATLFIDESGIIRFNNAKGNPIE